MRVRCYWTNEEIERFEKRWVIVKAQYLAYLKKHGLRQTYAKTCSRIKPKYKSKNMADLTKEEQDKRRERYRLYYLNVVKPRIKGNNNEEN